MDSEQKVPWGLDGNVKIFGRRLSSWALFALLFMLFSLWWSSYTTACENACADVGMEAISMRGFFPNRCACLGVRGDLKVLEIP